MHCNCDSKGSAHAKRNVTVAPKLAETETASMQNAL